MTSAENALWDPISHTDGRHCRVHLSSWVDHLLPLLPPSLLHSRALPRIHQSSMDRLQDREGGYGAHAACIAQEA